MCIRDRGFDLDIFHDVQARDISPPPDYDDEVDVFVRVDNSAADYADGRRGGERGGGQMGDFRNIRAAVCHCRGDVHNIHTARDGDKANAPDDDGDVQLRPADNRVRGSGLCGAGLFFVGESCGGCVGVFRGLLGDLLAARSAITPFCLTRARAGGNIGL